MAADPDDAQVTYTVRELLEGIKHEQTQGFTRLEASMAGKADKADVARLEARLDHHATQLQGHDREIEGLKQSRRDDRQRHKRAWRLWQKLAAGAGSFLLIAGAYFGPYIGNHL